MMPSHRDEHGHRLSISGDDWLKLREQGGFMQYGSRIAQHGRATDFFLLSSDGTSFRFSVEMVDLEERLEVGVLSIEAVPIDQTPKSLQSLPIEFSEKLRIERLVLQTEHGDIDSGLVLASPGGSEITVISGAYPYTVEIMMTQILSPTGRFEPEYRMANYARLRLDP